MYDVPANVYALTNSVLYLKDLFYYFSTFLPITRLYQHLL